MTISPATSELIVRYRAAHGKVKAATEELQRTADGKANNEIQSLLVILKQRAQEEVMTIVGQLHKFRPN